MQQPGSPFLPPWERAGAAIPAEPSGDGLPFSDAFRKWGNPVLWQRYEEARRLATAAEDERKAAEPETNAAALRDPGYWIDRIAGESCPRRPPVAVIRYGRTLDAGGRAEAAKDAARRAAVDEFGRRWAAGAFIAFGDRGNVRELVRASNWGAFDFRPIAPGASPHIGPGSLRSGGSGFRNVLFYRVADHPEWCADLADGASGAPSAAASPPAAKPAPEPMSAPRGLVDKVANQILEQQPDLKKLLVTEAAKRIAKQMEPEPPVDTVRRYISPNFPKRNSRRAKRKF